MTILCICHDCNCINEMNLGSNCFEKIYLILVKKIPLPDKTGVSERSI